MEALLTDWPGRRAALIVAHPGHELRVFGWLEQARPLAFVFTDGSGGASEGRIGSTARLLDSAGGRRAALFGRFTDRQIYQLVMDGRHEVFTDLAREIAGDLAAAGIDYVVGDAVEGYNPGHDICRMVVGAAVAMAERATGRRIPDFDFLLVGRPDECPAGLQARSIHLVLDDAALRRKAAAARAYAGLARELELALERAGLEAFRHEWLRPAAGAPDFDGFSRVPPYYETYGEKMVAAGRYRDVLRWEQHMKPLAGALLGGAGSAAGLNPEPAPQAAGEALP